ncbi:MAG: hypothetical protein ACLP9L_27935 [Thermoguttaceae bacterium]
MDRTRATYTVTVSNAVGAGATSGTMTVTETAPSGNATRLPKQYIKTENRRHTYEPVSTLLISPR